jgi:hypothetical protein
LLSLTQFACNYSQNTAGSDLIQRPGPGGVSSVEIAVGGQRQRRIAGVHVRVIEDGFRPAGADFKHRAVVVGPAELRGSV